MHDFLVHLGSFLLGGVGTLITVRQLVRADRDAYAAECVKQREAERDFAHLERNLKQLQTGQDLIMRSFEAELDKIKGQLAELKVATKALYAQVTGEPITKIFINRDKD